MTKPIDPQTPAYPRNHRYDGHNGLTKRELFAAMAMQGMVGFGWSPSLVAFEAVKHADALIVELNKEEEQP